MPDPYVVEIPLRWSDMDAYAHVNNVQFLRLLEEARILGLAHWFADGPSLLEEGVVVAHQSIEYTAPLLYRQAPVAVDMWVSAVHGSGFVIGYTVRDPAGVGDATYAVAETGIVSYDFLLGVPRRLSTSQRERLSEFAGDPVAFRRVRS